MSIFSREGSRPRVSRFFFKSVIQLVFFFGAETWVVTPRMGRVLGVFHEQVAQQLTRRIPRQWVCGKWEYTSAEAERMETRFDIIETYIRRIHNTYVQYIATRSLLEISEATERKRGVQVGMRWW